MIKGRTLIAEEATRENFFTLGPDYQILHFATHGKVNDDAVNYSYIAFTPTGEAEDANLLYLRDLYNIRLSAALVVLSACETGVGQLHKGEGMVSLARGFSYAGVGSILMTFWNINDQCTAEIMQSFYRQLRKSMPKDEALRKAKLNYLNGQNKSDAHPFFWAAYIPTGDMTALDTPHSHYLLYVALGFAVLMLIILVVYRRRRQ